MGFSSTPFSRRSDAPDHDPPAPRPRAIALSPPVQPDRLNGSERIAYRILSSRQHPAHLFSHAAAIVPDAAASAAPIPHLSSGVSAALGMRSVRAPRPRSPSAPPQNDRFMAPHADNPIGPALLARTIRTGPRARSSTSSTAAPSARVARGAAHQTAERFKLDATLVQPCISCPPEQCCRT